ncbi:MAG: TIGR01620 family protein [Pseudomonadota bacterium]
MTEDRKSAAPQGPLVIELDAETLPEAPSPAEAPPPVDIASGLEGSATEQAILSAARPPRWGIGRMVVWLTGAFVMLWLGVAVTDFVTALFARHSWLGWVGSALLVGLVIVLIVLILREIAALSRLGRIETVRRDADDVHETGSAEALARVMRGLDRLYRARPDLEWARERVETALADTPDPGARLSIAEQEYLTELDRRAEAAVTRAARTVAAATALIPLALADVLAALFGNLRMVREISEIYGGRAGWLGSWRLMRTVAAHLVATGAVAAADDMLGPLVGGGVLGKISRRFGEGAVNGALTARVGVSAIEVCRPLPFCELDRPSASGLVLQALKAWRSSNDATG